jgi:hypothetical protein
MFPPGNYVFFYDYVVLLRESMPQSPGRTSCYEAGTGIRDDS